MELDAFNEIGKISKETKLLATKEAITFSCAIVGFHVYYVDFDGKSGWVSSQSNYDAPEIVVDKSILCKGCFKAAIE